MLGADAFGPRDTIIVRDSHPSPVARYRGRPHYRIWTILLAVQSGIAGWSAHRALQNEGIESHVVGCSLVQLALKIADPLLEICQRYRRASGSFCDLARSCP